MCGASLDAESSFPPEAVTVDGVLYFNSNPGSSASFSLGSTLTGKLYTSSPTFGPKYRSTSKCQSTKPLSSRSVLSYKLHDSIRNTPANIFTAMYIFRDKLIGL